MVNHVFWWCAGWLLRLRYRVTVIGGERLAGLKGPTIVMPNHPAYMDPPLILSHIRLRAPLRPLVFSGTYRNPAFYPIMYLIGAVEVPDLREHSRGAQQATLAMIERIAVALRRGESILIYPSGRLQRRGTEVIGAARAAAELLRACPEANIVRVRTRGVWGSMYSFAQTGDYPQLRRCMLRSLLYALASLLFFMPRRNVTLTVETMPRGGLGELMREQLNPTLEDWYNDIEQETPIYVPYHRWFGPRQFTFPAFRGGLEIEFDPIKPATQAAVQEMVEEHLDRPLTDQERDSATTLEQLGLDSLERMDLALEIEHRFGFRSDRVAETLVELGALADGLMTGGSAAIEPAPTAWTRPPSDTEPTLPLADTLAAALVRRALAHPDDVAAADRLSGVLTYRRLLVAASLMSKRLARLDGQTIGVLLPASVAADIVFFALHLAGKLPVILNWTTGPANLAHAVTAMEIRHVVTSHRFVDRLGIEWTDSKFTYLEDIRQQIRRRQAMRELLRTYLSPGSYVRQLSPVQIDDPAVVLFTSGSEAAPKAVPLSHRNLMANLRAGAPALQLTRADIILGFLPPFHSFGLTGNLVMSLVLGVRVIHHADPTDSSGLVRTLAAYRPTLLFSTPTFLGYMLARATPEDFASLRIVVTGAEKCPQTVRDACAESHPGPKSSRVTESRNAPPWYRRMCQDAQRLAPWDDPWMVWKC